MTQVGACQLRPWQNDPFDMLIRSVASQQLSTRAAATILGRVRQALGCGERFDPVVLADTVPQQLRDCGLSRSKAGYCIGLGEYFSARPEALTRMARADDDEVLAQLVTLKGVGPWTAHMLLIFAFGRSDIWPVGDLGIRKAAALFFKLGQIPNAQALDTMADPWRPYRSIASWYLWRSLDLA